MRKVFTNIHLLAGVHKDAKLLRNAALAELPILTNAYLTVNDGCITNIGVMADWDASLLQPTDQVIDLQGKSILPCWCDSHTHLVFAASREQEFVAKLQGKTYAEIAAAGGGILNSARKVAETAEATLFAQASERLQAVMRLGTGAIEIKSGYGLSLESELKMLRVIAQLKASYNIPIKATFLGAHAYPEAYKHQPAQYINLIINEMLPAIASEQLADYVDVFCEQGFFSVADTLRICEAAATYGIRPKIHANQLHVSGGVQAGIQANAISVDHLESMDVDAIQALAQSNTIGTMLPTAAYFLRMPYPPARTMIDAGCALALASDFNPGSSPSGNMNIVVSMACIQMKMLPEEAINAATIQGAHAMEVAAQVGSISVGKKANFIVTQPIPSIAYIPYAFGTNLIHQVYINGEPI
ncbi:MAG: imidazolonepropionase [Chitinophagaceae bacterium]